MMKVILSFTDPSSKEETFIGPLDEWEASTVVYAMERHLGITPTKHTLRTAMDVLAYTTSTRGQRASEMMIHQFLKMFFCDDGLDGTYDQFLQVAAAEISEKGHPCLANELGWLIDDLETGDSPDSIVVKMDCRYGDQDRELAQIFIRGLEGFRIGYHRLQAMGGETVGTFVVNRADARRAYDALLLDSQT